MCNEAVADGSTYSYLLMVYGFFLIRCTLAVTATVSPIFKIFFLLVQFSLFYSTFGENINIVHFDQLKRVLVIIY